MAKVLEKYGAERGIPWGSTVKIHAEKIDRNRAHEAGDEKVNVPPPLNESSSSCIFSPKWLKLFEDSLKEIEGREIGGRWYVICATPKWMLQWRELFCKAVMDYGAKLAFAFHATTGPDSCISMRAQWRMNIEHLKDPDPIGLLKERLRDNTSELGAWAEEAKKRGSKGSFEFFESYIAHFFTCILIVPESPNDKLSQDGIVERKKAPDGTFCVVGHYNFYPGNLDDRLGICMHRPSPLLDIYYNSITQLFAQGPKDGYLKPVDLLASRSRQKQK